jgi:hypothetical protein
MSRLEPGFHMGVRLALFAAIATIASCGTLRLTEGKCVVDPIDGEWVSWRGCLATDGADWRACACVGAAPLRPSGKAPP